MEDNFPRVSNYRGTSIWYLRKGSGKPHFDIGDPLIIGIVSSINDRRGSEGSYVYVGSSSKVREARTYKRSSNILVVNKRFKLGNKS